MSLHVPAALPKIFCHENLHFVKTYITLIRMVRKMMNDVSMVVKWKIGRPWAGHSHPRHFRNQGSSVEMQRKLRPKRLLWKNRYLDMQHSRTKKFQTYAISPKFFSSCNQFLNALQNSKKKSDGKD